MFVFIWLIVSLPTNNDASGQERNYTQLNGYSVTFKEGEIRAEAGLCAVIPCSFTSVFVPKHIIWYKCEPSKYYCYDSDPVFHSDNNKNVQPGFKDRVSLLEPDMTQKKCSIMINDLKKSDSGSYQLRAEGEGSGEAFTFTIAKTYLTVTDLKEKPLVTIPPLTGGQQATLTCTAPGLCSGSPPKITWMWRKEGKKDITGNVTAPKSENLTAFKQRHSSTLTFTPSAEHHNTSITCKVNFKDDITTKKTATLKVNYTKTIHITGNTVVEEGGTLNVTCSVDSFPPAFIKWSKFTTEMNNQEQKNAVISFPISKVTANDSGLYFCTADYLNTTLEKRINITITYTRKPQITGRTAVKEGDFLNLTCIVDSFPPSVISWTKSFKPAEQQSHIVTKVDGSSQICQQDESIICLFSIPNVTAEDAGLYICTAKHLNNTLTEEINVTVTYARKPQLSGNTTVMEGEDLNLTCSVDSVPPSVIKWTKSGTETDWQDNILSKADNSTVVYLQEKSGNVSFSIMNVTAEKAGRYICTATYQNISMTEEIHVKVNYLRKPRISRRTTVKEGEALNLTCSADSFPTSVITLTKAEVKTNQQPNISSNSSNSTETTMKGKHGNGSLCNTNVTAEHAGHYICTAKHLTNNLTEEISVTVTYKRNVQVFENATMKEEVLNLNCSVGADGFPPSVIRWTIYGTEKINILSKAHNSTEIYLRYEFSNVSFPIINETDAQRYGCRATYQNSTMEEKIHIVAYIIKPETSGRATVDEGNAENLTCTVNNFSPSVINLTIFEISNLQNNISCKMQNINENLKPKQSGIGTLLISNVTAEDAGLYICTAESLNRTQTEAINVTVTYKRRPQIIGNQTIKEGDALNLTCTVDSFPPSLIMWTDNSLSIHPNRTSFSNSTGSATLVIFNMTVEDSGRYICSATHENNTVTEYVDIKVTWSPKVLNGSGCVLRSDILTCVCISEGFPLPTIKWPFLKDHTEYSITNMVSNHTINNTVTVTVKTQGYISVECFSSNENGEAKENLTVLDWTEKEVSKHTTNLRKSSTLEIIIAFFIGLLLSPIIYCLFMKFYRKKEKNSGNLDESLEMISPLMSNGQAVEGGVKNEALAAAPEATNGPKELVYASINFSLLNRIPRKLVKISGNTHTEYAEIKTNKEKEGDPVEMMTEEDSETKNCVQEVEEEAEEAVYSKVEDLLLES